MKPLELQSERFSPTGNLSSKGVLNQLGRPQHDVLTVLVRETAQNSWDAREPSGDRVHYAIQGWNMQGRALTPLRELVFQDAPDNLGLREALLAASDHRGHAGAAGLSVLAISDRGTVGLGGPTRADLVAEGQPRHFVNLLRNVGQPNERQQSAGTYGYGKAAAYLASTVHTICVYTRWRGPGQPESRFIAAALGPDYRIKQDRPDRGLYTGRHWWGRYRGNIVEPILNAEADELAAALKLPGFEPDEFGTTLLILAPQFGERSPEQAMRFMSLSFLWSFWPTLLSRGEGIPVMAPHFQWEDTLIVTPDPTEYPPIHGFVQAMQNIQSRAVGDQDLFSRLVEIDCQRPIKHLGVLSLHRFQVQDQPAVDVGGDVDPSPIGVDELAHHVALMRQAGMVVRYVPGPPLPSDMIEYAGVFVADATVDQVFADAEPPTHDDWLFQSLQGTAARTFVRVALRRIDEATRAFVAPPDDAMHQGTAQAPLAGFAEFLGGLIPGETGPGPGVPFIDPEHAGGGVGGTQRGARPRVEFVDDGRLELVDGKPAFVAQFTVRPAAGSTGTVVSALAGAVLDDGRLESDPPADGQVPRVLRWEGPGGHIDHGESIEIPAAESGAWRVVISLVDDAIVGVQLTASARS